MFERPLCVALLSASGLAQVTLRVSVDGGGTQANGNSFAPSISLDGRYVAFASSATNLVPGDTNAVRDVFVRDRLLAAIERASVGAGGQESNGISDGASISADGRFVAFDSTGTNLVSADTNAARDIFVRDRQSGATTRVSVDSTGTEADGPSGGPCISSDGHVVAFASDATNLVAGDTNARRDVFVHDLSSGITERVSVDSTGTQGDGDSDLPSISADGRYVAFVSRATSLVPGDTNGAVDVFVHDRLSGMTIRASVDSLGSQSDGDSDLGTSLSADGRFVAFESEANNLVSGDTNACRDVFLHDCSSGATQRVSVDSSGAEGNGPGDSAAVSADGTCVVFRSGASNLVQGDSNGKYDIFLHDCLSGATERLSVDSAGMQGDGDSGWPSVSADGRFIALYSYSSNLVAGDTNGSIDVFVRDRRASGFTSLCDPGLGGVIACPCSNPPGGRGRGCDNSFSTGGAALFGSGNAYLSIDSLVFTTSDEPLSATSILLQGDALSSSGLVFGQGVRCASGLLKRMFTKIAVSGSITAPDLGGGDPTVSARSVQLGVPIQPGQPRHYLVYYRDPLVLGGCPTTVTFNATQTASVTYWP